MAFDIDDPETERLVRVLAERLGVSPEEAIRRAAGNELRRDDEAVTAPDRVRVQRGTDGCPTSTADGARR